MERGGESRPVCFMHPTLITPPALDPVTLAEAKAHIRLEHDEDDLYVGGLIKAATDLVETLTGRVVLDQTWQLQVANFAALHLPRSPVIEVTAIECRTFTGELEELPADAYQVRRYPGGAELLPMPGKRWPLVPPGYVDGVTVRWRAGEETAAQVPPAIRHAVLLLVGHFYESRLAVEAASSAVEMPMGVEALLSRHRVWSVR